MKKTWEVCDSSLEESQQNPTEALQAEETWWNHHRNDSNISTGDAALGES